MRVVIDVGVCSPTYKLATEKPELPRMFNKLKIDIQLRAMPSEA
jgi:hypothetical protein